MDLAPVKLEPGEIYGKLTVRFKSRDRGHYICGCICGYSKVKVSATQLMRGKVKACLKCRSDGVR